MWRFRLATVGCFVGSCRPNATLRGRLGALLRSHRCLVTGNYLLALYLNIDASHYSTTHWDHCSLLHRIVSYHIHIIPYLLGRPHVVTGGLLFCSWFYFFFYLFRPPFSEFPRPIALKLCHMVGIWPNFIIPLPKFGGGGAPPKKLGAKNMQNFGQFWTTSDFDREYLKNEATYPKSERRTN